LYGRYRKGIMRKGFIFDQNKCVGCHACVVACQIENNDRVTMPWRKISTFNEDQFSSIPLFHFSLACNHCEDAPCIEGCPTLAYTRDDFLDIVKHHEDRCIGCKYCTWVCPYDAPKYSDENGIVEKCTLCEERLKDHKKPACANLCPTRALDYGDIESFREYSGFTGFPENNIQPSIRIVPLRKKNPVMDQTAGELNKELLKKKIGISEKKISLRSEWVLVLFTLICSLLAGVFYARFFNDFDVSPWLFLAIGLVGGFMTFLHLGKKWRAWRIILNVNHSWLSREIVSFGGFILLSGLFFLVDQSAFLGVLTVLCGFFLLYAIDKVYHNGWNPTKIPVHSANALLTGILFASLLSGNDTVYWAIGLIKLALYLYRKGYFMVKGMDLSLGLTWMRLVFGFILPLVLFLIYGLGVNTWIFGSILLGELIDRTEFYMELQIMSPSHKINKDLSKLLDQKK